ncbi:hypothetical protein WAI453_012251 [Rhynchosporium graminicola]|uniref:Uncharacterized protein n=2 Tax=Rhynchosporium TaxID=38037 RepID=A0A1E1ME50_RHYSE|nr:uncharacterized protein RCO7_06079 [Rhynchosporium commune]CZT47317.1 uncharacterized protein RSE6_07860 [Rhynchosporium secalis]
MKFQYRFTHTCNHTGIGPITDRQTARSQDSSISTTPSSSTTTIPLSLPFACPFCTTPFTHHLSTIPGDGVLTILPPFPTAWTVIRACTFAELEPMDWYPACVNAWVDGQYIQMAWIARPLGNVTADGVDDVDDGVRRWFMTTRVGAGWRLRGYVRGVGYGNFAGLLSSLHKSVSDREVIE